MLMTEYETTLVIRPDLSGDVVETTLDRVRDVVNNDGKMLEISHWGKRKLAYDVAKHSRGIYVHTHYLGNSALVAELERNLRISDNVLRFLTVRLNPRVNPEQCQVKEYVRPEYDADEGSSDEASSSRGEPRPEAAAAAAVESADKPAEAKPPIEENTSDAAEPASAGEADTDARE